MGLPLTLSGRRGAAGRARRGRLPSGSSGESRYRWSFTTSASRRDSRSAPGERATPTRARPPICSRATWPAAVRAPPSEPRAAARSGRPHARGAGGRAPRARGPPRRARGEERAGAAGAEPPRRAASLEPPEPMQAEPTPRAEPIRARRFERERAVTSEHAVATAPDEPTPTHDTLAEPVPADTDGHGRDWPADAPQLTHGGDGGGGQVPGRGRTARGRRGPGRFIALGVLVAIVLGIAWFANSLLQPFKGDGGKTVRVTIPQGSSLSADRRPPRAERGLEDAGFFQLRARIAGRQRQPSAGPLRAPGGHELLRALDALKEGVPPDVVQVAHPRGPLAQGDRAANRAACGATTCAAPVARRRSIHAPTRRQGRDEPRGLPLPGHLRAQEGPDGCPPARPSSSPTSRATSRRWTCATPSARTSPPTTC